MKTITIRTLIKANQYSDSPAMMELRYTINHGRETRDHKPGHELTALQTQERY
jgi:hypothetical protein